MSAVVGTCGGSLNVRHFSPFVRNSRPWGEGGVQIEIFPVPLLTPPLHNSDQLDPCVGVLPFLHPILYPAIFISSHFHSIFYLSLFFSHIFYSFTPFISITTYANISYFPYVEAKRPKTQPPHFLFGRRSGGVELFWKHILGGQNPKWRGPTPPTPVSNLANFEKDLDFDSL